MSKKRKTVQKSRGHLPLIAMMVLTLVAVAVVLMWPKSARAGYTVEEQHQFFDSEIRPVVEEIAQGRTPYPEINERFQSLYSNVVKRTGKAFGINMFTNYHALSKDAQMAVGAHPDGAISLAIYVPSLMDSYEEAKRSFGNDWRSKFQICVLTVFMHEMEHTTQTSSMRNSVSLSEESRAWAETCRYTLDPLSRKYGKTLFWTDAGMMKNWIASDGNTNSAEWNEYISRLYGSMVK